MKSRTLTLKTDERGREIRSHAWQSGVEHYINGHAAEDVWSHVNPIRASEKQTVELIANSSIGCPKPKRQKRRTQWDVANSLDICLPAR